MNKNLILTSLMVISMMMSACVNATPAVAFAQSYPIQDPLLLEAWNRLNDQNEPVELWDGLSISGHDLAQFVLDRSIPVLWKTPTESTKVAFSVLQCRGESCTYGSSEKDIPPIILSSSLNDPERLDEIVDALAHEIYHRTQPYGRVIPTLYEEYGAYYIGAQLSGKMWTDFETYNPLVPACLVQWFYDNKLFLGTYRDDQAYPISIMEAVDSDTTICANSSGGPFTTPTAYKLSCALTLENRFDCQFVIPTSTPEPDYRLECEANSLGIIECKKILSSPEQP